MVIVIYFMENYVAFKKYTKITLSHFINLTRSHYSQTVKTYTVFGMLSLSTASNVQ